MYDAADAAHAGQGADRERGPGVAGGAGAAGDGGPAGAAAGRGGMGDVARRLGGERAAALDYDIMMLYYSVIYNDTVILQIHFGRRARRLPKRICNLYLHGPAPAGRRAIIGFGL